MTMLQKKRGRSGGVVVGLLLEQLVLALVEILNLFQHADLLSVGNREIKLN